MEDKYWDKFWRFNGGFFYELGNWFYWNFFYSKLLGGNFRENSAVLELGGGAGTVSLRLAEKYGAKVTIVDFSNECRKMATEHFRRAGKSLDFRCEDILKFKANRKFDLVHSEGVVEHFFGSNRVDVIKKHLESMKKDGKTIIIAPAKNFLHPIRLFILHLIEPRLREEPFSLGEFRKIVSKIPGYRITGEIKTILDVAVGIERNL